MVNVIDKEIKGQWDCVIDQSHTLNKSEVEQGFEQKYVWLYHSFIKHLLNIY